MRIAPVLISVVSFVLVGAGLLFVYVVNQSLRPRFPTDIAEPSFLGLVVEAEAERVSVEDRAGRDRQLSPEPPVNSVYPPHGVLEPGAWVFTARIEGETYNVIAGRSAGCPLALEFPYGFDEPGSVVGVARFGYDEPVGFRFTKATDFRALDRPTDDGLWYDYRVIFCLNEAGEVVNAELLSLAPRPVAGLIAVAQT